MDQELRAALDEIKAEVAQLREELAQHRSETAAEFQAVRAQLGEVERLTRSLYGGQPSVSPRATRAEAQDRLKRATFGPPHSFLA